MTLDEAIKHTEEVAEEKESEAEYLEYSRLDWRYEANQCLECAEEHRQLAEWLKELKKLREQTRWIPVSERLPEEFESVLVCYKSQGGIAQTVSERLINMDGSNRWSALAGVEPIAWMPLPPPYKAESEDKE